ncbi:tRNA epoxyqueuosine(34) reductase QueG, partial [Myxococcota bacterium]|nr:tRNA epoxyqueuosine(34) reductase QueG [Myxococcota bacterium]
RADPRRLAPWAVGAVALWRAFPPPPASSPSSPQRPRGRVARYAAQRDYHNVLGKALKKLRQRMLSFDPSLQARISVDSGPVPERTLAYMAGLGFFGRSTMLINPRLGTYGALAVILINRRPPPAVPEPNRCGRCTACVDACPTQAISARGVDARRCISYWTIEHRAPYPEGVAERLGDWIFGCDVCQAVCPWNRRASAADPVADPAPWRPRPELAAPDLVSWLMVETEALHEAARGTPLRRAGGLWLRRAACVALANLGVTAARPALAALAARADEDPRLRAAAAWAALRLSALERPQPHADAQEQEPASEEPQPPPSARR